MKALKGKDASTVLSDPRGSKELKAYISKPTGLFQKSVKFGIVRLSNGKIYKVSPARLKPAVVASN